MSGGNTWVFYHRLGRRLDQCASPVAIRCRTPGIGGGGARFPVPRGVGDPGAAAAAAVTGGWRGGPGRRRRRQGGTGGGRWRSRGGRSSLFVFVARVRQQIGRAHV